MQSWIPTFYLDFYGVDVGKIGYFTGTFYPDVCLLCLGVAFSSEVVNEQPTKHMYHSPPIGDPGRDGPFCGISR